MQISLSSHKIPNDIESWTIQSFVKINIIFYSTNVALGDKMQILDFGYTHLDLGSLGQ